MRPELTVCRRCLHAETDSMPTCPHCGDSDRSFIVITAECGPVLVRGLEIWPDPAPRS